MKTTINIYESLLTLSRIPHWWSNVKTCEIFCDQLFASNAQTGSSTEPAGKHGRINFGDMTFMGSKGIDLYWSPLLRAAFCVYLLYDVFFAGTSGTRVALLAVVALSPGSILPMTSQLSSKRCHLFGVHPTLFLPQLSHKGPETCS